MNEKLVDFFERRPDIRDKFKFDGTFRDYASDIKKSVTIKNEYCQLKKYIIKEAKRLLPGEFPLEELENQLSKYPFISYADHHGLLNYKLLYNSNLLHSLIIKEFELPFIIVMATGNIPLKNISFPRGFYFKNQKFNFFGVKHEKTPVCLLKDKLHVNRKRGIESFIRMNNVNSLDIEEKKFLDFLFFECMEIESAEKNLQIFSDQLTFLNYKLWKYYYEKSIRDSIPNIIYLQTNQIITSIILDELKKEDSMISLILFNPDVRKKYLRNFDGIGCCWGENRGSQLFWGIVEKKNVLRLINLYVDDSLNSLIGANFNLKLEKESVIDALLSQKILPTQFFDFLIVTFMNEFLALGGFNQVEYLPQMQKAHIKTLEEIGMNDLVSKFETPLSHGLICGMYPFDFDSGIDLIWHFNSKNGKFNGNMDGGLTQEGMDKVSHTPLTELISTGIDKTLEIFI